MKKRNRDESKTTLIRLVGSLLLAVLVWYAINGSSNNIITRDIINVPVSVINEDVLSEKGLVYDNSQNYYVNLQVRGTESSLDSIDQEAITAEIDLSKIESPGKQDLEVVIKGLNNTVILDETVPEIVEVNVDKFTNQARTPEIITQGKPADGLMVISTQTPDKVNLGGTNSEIEKVDQVSGIVSVNGMNEDSTQLVHVYAYDEEGNQLENVSCTPDIVTAQIQLGISKQVDVNVPKIDGAVENGYKITEVSVKPNRISVVGKTAAINAVTSLNVNPVTVPESSKNKSFSSESELILPEGVDVLNSSYTVQVSVSIEQIIERTYSVTNLETINLGKNLEVTRISPGSVTVRVSGTASELQKFDASSLKGTIDLNGLGAGEHKVNVNINIKDVSLVSVSPTGVEVSLTEKKQN